MFFFYSHSLSENKIRTIFENSEGNIFIGTEQQGVNIIYRNKNIFKWLIHDKGNENSLSSNTVSFICAAENDNLLIGLGKSGIDYYRESENKFEKFDILHRAYPGLFINDAILINKDAVLLSTKEHGLFGLNITTGNFNSIPLYSDTANPLIVKNTKTVCRDSQGRYWIGTASGIFILNENLEQVRHIKCEAESNDSGIIFTLLKYQDRIIAGTHDGILFLDYKKGITKHLKHDPKNANTLSHHTIFSLCIDRNNFLWAGTFGKGLDKIDLITDSVKHFSTIDGLPNNSVYGILEDENGYLWIGTGRGLTRFNPNNRKFQNYFVEDGLVDNTFTRACFNNNGEFCFGTERGVVKFNPLEIIENTKPPNVVITGFNILNKSVKSEYELSKCREIEISYRDDIFSFDYIGVNISSPRNVKYVYKLDGLSDEWTEAGSQRKAIFTNVPPGSYKFSVKACNEYGYWSEASPPVQVYIVPPYYDTVWFRFLLFISFITVLYVIYLYRIRQIKKIEKIRLQIASDLHDEIGSNLGSITIMSNALKRKYSAEVLDKIHHTSLKSASSIRDIVWFINPENDDSVKIISKMKSFCEDTLEGFNYKFIMNTGNLFDELSLEKKRNLYLILKEAVNNIIKHSGAGNVMIVFSKNENKLSMEISDDGKGFEHKESNGSGLKSIKKRAEEINADLNITSTCNGTTVLTELR